MEIQILVLNWFGAKPAALAVPNVPFLELVVKKMAPHSDQKFSVRWLIAVFCSSEHKSGFSLGIFPKMPLFHSTVFCYYSSTA